LLFVKTMLKTSTTQIKKILWLQFVLGILVALLSLWVSNPFAISVIAGAMIAALGNAYFAWKVFFKTRVGQKQAQPTEILTTYYGAEVGKIILTVMLFVTAFNAIKQLNVIALMCAYLFITMIPMLVSFFINTDEEDATKNWRDDNVE
jgi:F0F1-type ATP synthase assembly protein I